MPRTAQVDALPRAAIAIVPNLFAWRVVIDTGSRKGVRAAWRPGGHVQHRDSPRDKQVRNALIRVEPFARRVPRHRGIILQQLPLQRGARRIKAPEFEHGRGLQRDAAHVAIGMRRAAPARIDHQRARPLRGSAGKRVHEFGAPGLPVRQIPHIHPITRLGAGGHHDIGVQLVGDGSCGAARARQVGIAIRRPGIVGMGRTQDNEPVGRSIQASYTGTGTISVMRRKICTLPPPDV